MDSCLFRLGGDLVELSSELEAAPLRSTTQRCICTHGASQTAFNGSGRQTSA
jgi:hypothetical protein